MATMKVLPPMRFRFHADDAKKYGRGWHTYDESKVMRLPAGDLIEIESTIGATVMEIFTGFRRNSTLGVLAAMWITLGMENEKTVPKWDDFTPLALLAEWETVPSEADALEADPTPLASDSSEATASLS